MNGRTRIAVAGALASAAVAAGAVAYAGGGDSVRETLSGYEEDPVALSTTGTGTFKARLDVTGPRIHYRLSYSGLESPVTQAHIHLGARAQSGGIVAFLCSNLGNGPAGTQVCPAAPATVTGTIEAADVIGPAGQGIAAGEFDEVLDAAVAGVTYVNVHSDTYPAGEIRAQLHVRR